MQTYTVPGAEKKIFTSERTALPHLCKPPTSGSEMGLRLKRLNDTDRMHIHHFFSKQFQFNSINNQTEALAPSSTCFPVLTHPSIARGMQVCFVSQAQCIMWLLCKTCTHLAENNIVFFSSFTVFYVTAEDNQSISVPLQFIYASNYCCLKREPKMLFEWDAKC